MTRTNRNIGEALRAELGAELAARVERVLASLDPTKTLLGISGVKLERKGENEIVTATVVFEWWDLTFERPIVVVFEPGEEGRGTVGVNGETEELTERMP